jgi:phytoene synthase
MTPDPSRAETTAIVRKSRSNLAFALASLPRQRREDMESFYAFCRIVDDLADDDGIPPAGRQEGLQRWRDVLHGRATGLSAFESSILGLQQRYRIPTDELEQIIDGVSTDLAPVRFATWEDLRKYCYQVASCVGLVSIRIFGCRTPESRTYAEQLGYALQLTNILRDIGTDWDQGRRLYLPLDEMSAAGCSEQDIAAHRYHDGFFRLMNSQIARARQFYAAAAAAWRPADARALLAAETMRRIYSRTLDLMEADGCRVFDVRYRLSTPRKALFVAAAWVKGKTLPQADR